MVAVTDIRSDETISRWRNGIGARTLFLLLFADVCHWKSNKPLRNVEEMTASASPPNFKFQPRCRFTSLIHPPPPNQLPATSHWQGSSTSRCRGHDRKNANKPHSDIRKMKKPLPLPLLTLLVLAEEFIWAAACP
jgi:hypothetical protein